MRRLIYTQRTFGGKPYQLVSVVQEADLHPQLERLRGETIEVIEVVDGEQVYYVVYKVVERGLPYQEIIQVQLMV